MQFTFLLTFNEAVVPNGTAVFVRRDIPADSDRSQFPGAYVPAELRQRSGGCSSQGVFRAEIGGPKRPEDLSTAVNSPKTL